MVYNSGMASGDHALRVSWSTDIQYLLDTNLLAIFTCANDYLDLAGERKTMEDLFANYVLYPRRCAFAAMSVFHPVGRKDAWNQANSFVYAIQGQTAAASSASVASHQASCSSKPKGMRQGQGSDGRGGETARRRQCEKQGTETAKAQNGNSTITDAAMGGIHMTQLVSMSPARSLHAKTKDGQEAAADQATVLANYSRQADACLKTTTHKLECRSSCTGSWLARSRASGRAAESGMHNAPGMHASMGTVDTPVHDNFPTSQEWQADGVDSSPCDGRHIPECVTVWEEDNEMRVQVRLNEAVLPASVIVESINNGKGLTVRVPGQEIFTLSLPRWNYDGAAAKGSARLRLVTVRVPAACTALG
jgi:hypothetical protein